MLMKWFSQYNDSLIHSCPYYLEEKEIQLTMGLSDCPNAQGQIQDAFGD